MIEPKYGYDRSNPYDKMDFFNALPDEMKDAYVKRLLDSRAFESLVYKARNNEQVNFKSDS